MIAHLGWVREDYVSCPRLAKDIEKGMRQPRPIPFRLSYFRNTFSMALPLANSSTSLSR